MQSSFNSFDAINTGSSSLLSLKYSLVVPSKFVILLLKVNVPNPLI